MYIILLYLEIFLTSSLKMELSKSLLYFWNIIDSKIYDVERV